MYNSYYFAKDTGKTLLDAMRERNLSIPAPCSGKGSCGKCRVKTAELGDVLACQTPLKQALTVLFDSSETQFPSLKGCEDVAIDIGTTTISIRYKDAEGKAQTASRLNAQRSFGADVISRIRFASQGKNELDMLKTALLSQFEGLDARNIAIAGNTVMELIASGQSPCSIGSAPYLPVDKLGKVANFIGNSKAYFAPCVSGFVGGDITAGLLASGILEEASPALFIDLGTNGEMVLFDGHDFLACSTAAGPVFEGAHISCGSGGIEGGISRAQIEADGQIKYSVIGGGKAKSLCGSGLLDIIAILLSRGKIDENGHLDGRSFSLSENVQLIQQDVIEFLLGKAAIAAGIRVLLKEMGMAQAALKRIVLTGGFGLYLDKENAKITGLLPRDFGGKITVIPDCAGEGAALLLKPENRLKCEALAKRISYLELAECGFFEEAYVDEMSF
ncbi:MAG: ASKHA domain-containing protein [Oscillospiraceae bacterium]|nr:ASKHA domain-containing protein [Oscillospiraceae bacterium]